MLWKLFKGGNYSRAETIRGNTVPRRNFPWKQKTSLSWFYSLVFTFFTGIDADKSLWLGITSLKGSGYRYESNNNSVFIANSMWHPRDGQDSTHHCVVLMETGQNWWDRKCSETFASICQIMSQGRLSKLILRLYLLYITHKEFQPLNFPFLY